jgi:hypothetical protein
MFSSMYDIDWLTNVLGFSQYLNAEGFCYKCIQILTQKIEIAYKKRKTGAGIIQIPSYQASLLRIVSK